VYAGHVRFHEGEAQIAPGVTVTLDLVPSFQPRSRHPGAALAVLFYEFTQRWPDSAETASMVHAPGGPLPPRVPGDQGQLRTPI
jgi:hypothetical protein